jgi:AraC-like DNA-binding protein
VVLPHVHDAATTANSSGTMSGQACEISAVVRPPVVREQGAIREPRLDHVDEHPEMHRTTSPDYLRDNLLAGGRQRGARGPPGRGTIARMVSSTGDAQHLRDLAMLRRVRDRIDREYARPLDVESLARGAHMSAGHLSRQFRLAYGESPYSYLMTRRVERAMTLLRRGDMSVTDVCFAVGCQSLGTFSTRFTELVGMSPGEYRRRSADATAGIPSCEAKRVTRPVRNREARSASHT